MKQKTTIALIVAIAALGATTISLSQSAQAESLIPEWIKSNAGWWSEGAVDDETFLL